MARLEGKLCVITGAARGIGAGIARAFMNEGAQVIITDINDEPGAALAQEIRCEYFHLDVRCEQQWDALLTTHPSFDVLVNNAGITGFETGNAAHDPQHASLKDWRAVHAVNLDGTFLGCRAALRAMRKNGGGSIINISSRSGMVGIPMAAAYASSKAAVRNHTKTVALYAAGEGLNIRCNSIHPAAILTPMWEPMLGKGEAREKAMEALVKDTPMKRFGTIEEVAALAVLLASDEAQYMTGAELTIDGGLLAGTVNIAPKD